MNQLMKNLFQTDYLNIRKWRREKSLVNTFKKRTELLENVVLTENEKDYIENLKKEVHE